MRYNLYVRHMSTLQTNVTADAEAAAVKRTRNTLQRKAVLSAVQSLNGCHPTAADIFVEVRTSHPSMSLATVYRALHALVEQNSISEMRVDNVARYDAGSVSHHHVVCRRCGSITDVGADALPSTFLRTLERKTGFQLDRNPLQISGVCPACRR